VRQNTKIVMVLWLGKTIFDGIGADSGCTNPASISQGYDFQAESKRPRFGPVPWSMNRLVAKRSGESWPWRILDPEMRDGQEQITHGSPDQCLVLFLPVKLSRDIWWLEATVRELTLVRPLTFYSNTTKYPTPNRCGRLKSLPGNASSLWFSLSIISHEEEESLGYIRPYRIDTALREYLRAIIQPFPTEESFV